MTVCEIIIPYWQKQEGILLRAVQSIFAQTFQDFHIIIVDDESPCPASVDLAHLSEDQMSKVTLITQKNTKQAGARNAGLNACSPNTQIVAFLDSDDMWEPTHLERAVPLFTDQNIDFYWASVFRDDAFAENYELPSKIVPHALQKTIEGHPDIFEVTNLPCVLSGQWFRHMHLSPTIISKRLAQKVRFDETLVVSEDFDFLVKCAEHAQKCAATDLVGARRSTGENIWHGIETIDWKYNIEKFYQMRILKGMLHLPQIQGEYRDILKLRIQGYREFFYWGQIERVKRKHLPQWDIWKNWLSYDPQILLVAASIALKLHPSRGRTQIPGDDSK